MVDDIFNEVHRLKEFKSQGRYRYDALEISQLAFALIYTTKLPKDSAQE